MKARCENERELAFPRYGGRGITVCREWSSDFSAFRTWALTHGYEPHLTLDRKDNDAGYSPENCRWATYKEQAWNTRFNRHVVHDGKQTLVCDLAERHGMSGGVLRHRLFRYGWPIERALRTPVAARSRRAA